jgi:TetR/AcrR family transcriptional regulator
MVKQGSKPAPRVRRDRPRTSDTDTEQRILEAAHDVFVRRGTAGARMQEIAAAAGVNSALLHYYFRSKARLSEAVFRRVAGQLLPAVVGILASERDLPAKVEAVVELELSHLALAPYLPAYLISELAHHPDRAGQLVTSLTGLVPREVGRQVLGSLRAQIAEAVRLKRMHPISPEQFVVNLLSLCIFPFAARPMLLALFGTDAAGFGRFLAERRKDLPAFFLRAMRP